ncbi:MAG: MarR family winged helix-turn-helix transcriptional regulator [Schaedlerella sp.]|nr:MarR family winged helix-turn-helix transcriptional regulator [Schaedlerella sp.]
MNAYTVIDDLLVNLFRDILDIENRALCKGQFENITVNDMHIISSIGIGEGKNMSAIARDLNITVGSLTTSMNALVKKQYVVRERSEEDRRIVNIRLTEKGEEAYYHHEDFHKKLVETVIDFVPEKDLPGLVKCLTGVCEFFRSYEV